VAGSRAGDSGWTKSLRSLGFRAVSERGGGEMWWRCADEEDMNIWSRYQVLKSELIGQMEVAPLLLV
jgi:hypothetical protein